MTAYLSTPSTLEAYLPTTTIKGGAFGTLSMSGDWIKKEDKEGSTKPSTIRREWEVLCLLQGTDLVPEVDMSFPSDGVYFYQRYIPSNTFNQYIKEYVRGYINATDMRKVLASVRVALDRFYALGWVHNDLHGGNLLISRKGHEWVTTIIDVAFATSPEAPPSEDMISGLHFGIGIRSSGKHDIHRLRAFAYRRFPTTKMDYLLEEFFLSLNTPRLAITRPNR